MPSREPPAVAPPLRASPGRARLLWLQLIASLVPFVALALVEAALRLAGYGDAYPLFVASADDARWLQPNPAVIERYFPPQLAPELAIAPNYFRRDKPADGIRIFVQGGSTAAGFPVEPAASLARLLRYRLGQSFPERPLEVVDTAMSAVTSVTLLDFADEIIAAEPDAVLIYAGHNEYLGIFGIGSAYRGASSRLATRLSFGIDELRLYQLLRNTWFEIRRRSSRPAASEATTLMAAIAAEQEIALDSADFRRGVSQWRRNLRALIERYTAAGIPVFVATVASNLSDQPPFISAPLADDVRAEAAARLAALSVVPLDADTAPPDPTPALARLEAIAAEQGSAELYFALGRAHERRGNDDDARRAFELAREHDLLRFRAPAAINAVVRELTRTTAARLVDVETVFVAAAPRGLVGDELMLEHLHPTVDGYFLLADAFYDALAAAAVPAPFPRVVDDAAARAELGIFAAEEYFARAAIAELQSDFPFAASPRAPLLPPVLSPSDALGRAWFAGEISWLELAEAARELVAAEPLARAVASQRIADALPFRPDLAERAAADWLAAGRPEAAARYAEAARYGSSGR